MLIYDKMVRRKIRYLLPLIFSFFTIIFFIFATSPKGAFAFSETFIVAPNKLLARDPKPVIITYESLFPQPCYIWEIFYLGAKGKQYLPRPTEGISGKNGKYACSRVDFNKNDLIHKVYMIVSSQSTLQPPFGHFTIEDTQNLPPQAYTIELHRISEDQYNDDELIKTVSFGIYPNNSPTPTVTATPTPLPACDFSKNDSVCISTDSSRDGKNCFALGREGIVTDKYSCSNPQTPLCCNVRVSTTPDPLTPTVGPTSGACYKCKNSDYSYSFTDNNCYKFDWFGNRQTEPRVEVPACYGLQVCRMGTGCVAAPDTVTVSPPAAPCTDLKQEIDPQTGKLKSTGECLTVKTAVGKISTSPSGLVGSIFSIILSMSGGIAILLIIFSGYTIMTSQGNPEKIQGAKETLTSAIVGLLFLIFSFAILQIITVDIFHIPSFK